MSGAKKKQFSAIQNQGFAGLATRDEPCVGGETRLLVGKGFQP